MNRPFDSAKYKALLEGLEISEVTFGTVLDDRVFRFEAEFYISQSMMPVASVSGEGIIDTVQYGTSDELNDDDRGFPVLRLNEFDNYFSGIPSRYCDKLSNEEFASLRLRPGDVLVCRTNGNPELVGRAAVVMEETPYAYASYLYKIRPKIEVILPEVLVLFLRSKHGRTQIEKYSMRSNQTNFSPAKFREIEIPKFGSALQLALQANVQKSYICLKQSHVLYAEAEQFLLRELSFENWQPPSKTVSRKNFSDFLATGRLDAEYYQPKYDALATRLNKMYTVRLGDIAGINKSIEPGSEEYQNEGVPFLRVADLSAEGITPTEIFLDPKNYADALRPMKDTILFSKDGSVGIAYKVEQDMEAITSSAILHLNVITKDINPDYLTLVLNSIIVQMQAERDAGGSIIQHWKPSEISAVIIPVLPAAIQSRIAEKIRESFTLRAQSQQLLALAQRAVETAIELGEAEGLEMLDKKIERNEML